MATDYARRTFSGIANPEARLASGINATDLAFSLDDATGYPDGTGGKFAIVIDRGGIQEEVLCSARSGNNFTIAALADRAQSGTLAASHSAGVRVEHTSSKRDFDEANKVVSDLNTWTTLAPTIGDLGSMTATITADARDYYRYLRVGKLCWVQFNQIITPGGTRQASYSVLLPVAAAHAHNVFACSVENMGGFASTADSTDRVFIGRYDAATLTAGTTHHTFSGVYETA